MTTDLLRLLLAPALVVGATLVGRRWGPRVAGVFGGFPFVGGPVLLVIALEHDAGFAARAATASLLGLAAWIVFVYVYVVVATRGGGVRVAVLAGWAAFAGCAALLTALPDSAPLGLVVVLATLLLARRAWPAGGAAQAVRPRRHVKASTELTARALAACALVAAVTLLASRIGPVAAGVLAPFPILATILAAFTHRAEGITNAERLLAGLLVGVRGFIAFSFVLALTLGHVPTGVAFALGLVPAALVITWSLGRVPSPAVAVRHPQPTATAATDSVGPRG